MSWDKSLETDKPIHPLLLAFSTLGVGGMGVGVIRPGPDPSLAM